jgi:hypothetical protein
MVSPFSNRAGRSGVSGSAFDGFISLSALKLFEKKDKAVRAKLDLRKDLRFIEVIIKNNKTLGLGPQEFTQKNKQVGIKNEHSR